jgi:L-2,4-diaminobutyric acid acetyltransferase
MLDTVEKHVLRKPQKHDGAAVWELIARVGTLDLNSAYCYMLLCDRYQDTCVVAESEDRIIGFVSALRLPTKPDRLFAWQIAVEPVQQGRGLGAAMVSKLLSTSAEHERVRFIEATISSSNTASLRLFQSIAREIGCPMEIHRELGYPANLFPQGQQHEAEPLIVIGPLNP